MSLWKRGRNQGKPLCSLLRFARIPVSSQNLVIPPATDELVVARSSIQGVVAAVSCDPLKWPAIYRLNMDVFKGMTVSENLLNVKLREGVHLKYVTPQAASQTLHAPGNKLWVFGMASAPPSLNGLVESTVLLMKNGHHVYLTKCLLADEEWIGLRVGLFQGISEPLAMGQELKSLLAMFKDLWIGKINRDELHAYGGY